jgi:ribosomal protein L32
MDCECGDNFKPKKRRRTVKCSSCGHTKRVTITVCENCGKERFRDFVSRKAKEVEKWPKWKKGALGPNEEYVEPDYNQ